MVGEKNIQKPFIVIGAGGHAKVLIDTLLLAGANIAGIVDQNHFMHGTQVLGVTVVGGDEFITSSPHNKYLLVNAIGSINLPTLRSCIYDEFKKKGYSFATVIHPSAIIASGVILDEGAQIMAGAVIQPGTIIGNNTIINTKCSVDHDCIIGESCHIAPGVTLSGGVSIGHGVHVGTGATIVQGITIGSNCLIAAGAVVTKNVESNSKVRGVPAVAWS